MKVVIHLQDHYLVATDLRLGESTAILIHAISSQESPRPAWLPHRLHCATLAARRLFLGLQRDQSLQSSAPQTKVRTEPLGWIRVRRGKKTEFVDLYLNDTLTIDCSSSPHFARKINDNAENETTIRDDGFWTMIINGELIVGTEPRWETFTVFCNYQRTKMNVASVSIVLNGTVAGRSIQRSWRFCSQDVSLRFSAL